MRDPFWDWGIWAFRASTAQANAAGGAIVLDVSPDPGDTMIVMWARGVNSGTNTLQILRVDEDNNQGPFLSSIGSGAGTVATMPRGFTTLTTSDFIDSTDLHSRTFRGDDRFTIQQTGAGAQNDTLVIDLRAYLSSSSIPTVAKGRSTNQANVTIATPTVNKIL